MQVIPREEARQRGLKRYFTGQPCKNGHVAERSTVNATCFDCKSDIAKRSYLKNPDSAKQRARARYDKKGPEIREYALRYFFDNREKCYERARDWSKKNRGKLRVKLKKWRADNPEKHRAQKSRRRARELGAEGEYTGNDINNLFVAQKGRCLNCKGSLDRLGYHIDHVMPLALGGTNWPDNLQLLCPSCNSRKSCKDPIQWANENGRLI